MGLNVCRTCIGSSDYSRAVYSFDDSDEADPELKRFSIDHDSEYILPDAARCAQAQPRSVSVLLAVEPAGMDEVQRFDAGRDDAQAVLRAVREVLRRSSSQGYAAAGVAIDAITVQNEVDTDQDGRMPACLWGQEYEIGVRGRHLGPRCATRLDEDLDPGPQLQPVGPSNLTS